MQTGPFFSAQDQKHKIKRHRAVCSGQSPTCYQINSQLYASSLYKANGVGAGRLRGFLVAVRASGDEEGFQQAQQAMAQAAAHGAVQERGHMRRVLKRACAKRNRFAQALPKLPGSMHVPPGHALLLVMPHAS